MITLLGHTTRALFDPGATHSFISSFFARELNQAPEPLKFQLNIFTPLGAEVGVSTVHKGCEIVLGEVKNTRRFN